MTTVDLTLILDSWSQPEGHPYKGELIDIDAYDGDGTEPPADLGCMCAQGQVLHLLGGWTPRQLMDANQELADLETAKLLNISISHAILLRQINDTVEGAPGIVLTNPELILGPNARGVLAIWRHFDAMTIEQWRAAWVARDVAFCAVAEMAGIKFVREHEKGEFVFLPVFGFANPAKVMAAYPE